MARRIKLKLPHHRASGRLCKCVGKYLNKHGKVVPRIFYFDPGDPDAAVVRVTALKRRWKELTNSGGKIWDESGWYRREYGAEQSPLSVMDVHSVVTVEDGAKLYLDHIKMRWQAAQCSKQHYTSQKERTERAVRAIRLLPLSVLDRPRLEAVVLALCNRPSYLLKSVETRRMSASYAKACVKSLKWCLDWLAEEGDWERCRQWNRLWKADVVLTPQERQQQLDGNGGETDYFTMEELKKLWTHADSDRLRCLILLGLNLAFANSECASLTTSEVKGLDTAEPYIERYRKKTVKKAGKGSYGKWFLWSETANYLRKCRAADNQAGLWLLSEDGHDLTEYDAIIQSWRRLAKRADVRPLGFKYLRKTSAHLIRNVLGYGSEIADMMLAHADCAMLRHYAGRDWDRKFREATQRLREHLSPMFEDASDDEKSALADAA